MVLSFRCPRCGNLESDEFEILDLDAPAKRRCEACSRKFSVVIYECAHCGLEEACVALDVSEQPDPQAIRLPRLRPGCRRP